MKLPRPFTALIVACVVAACSSSDQGSTARRDGALTTATVVTDAKVYTVDAKRSWAEAFAYDNTGTVIAVGSEVEVMARAGDHPRVIDAGGHMVLPGFQDPHLHVPEAGINESLCFMDPNKALAQYEKRAAECAKEQPGSGWVRAAGASLFNLRGATESPIDALDRAIPDRPALILDDLGHGAWTNSAGLAAAGILPDDPDPQGGIFHRNAATGRLDGLLLENAQQRLRTAAAVDDNTVYDGLLRAQAELNRNGITTVSDAGGFWAQNHPAAWQRALNEHKLTVRAMNALYVYPDLDVETQLAEFKRRFSNDSTSLLQFNTAKIYVDGILDLGTAAMLEPYDHPVDPNFPSGFFYFKRDELQRYVSELHAMGYRIHFHAIGDAAVRTALDTVAAIPGTRDAIAERRHRITHTYLVNPNDVGRFAELGVIADFQVGPVSTDTAYHEDLSELIGDRAFDLIPVKRLLESGAHVSLSSDWDADPLSPFGAIERSVTRETEAVPDVATAIELVTIDAAYALGHDDHTGSIEVGKFADYIIVDQNLLDIGPKDIHKTKVLLTMLGGKQTYRSPSFSDAHD